MNRWAEIKSVGQESLAAYAKWLTASLDLAAKRLLGGERTLTGELYRPLEVVQYRPDPRAVSEEGLGHRSYSAEEEDDEDAGDPKSPTRKRPKPRPVQSVLQRSCVILGDPGGGKSELLRHEVRKELERLRGLPDLSAPIYLRPPRPHRAEGCPQKPVGNAEGRGLDRAVQHQPLMPQGEILKHQVTTRLEGCRQALQNRKCERKHGS